MGKEREVAKWRIVPVEPTPEMVHVVCEDGYSGEERLAAAITVAPKYVVTDEDVHVASCAYLDASGAVGISHAVMRAALEAFVNRLGGES